MFAPRASLAVLAFLCTSAFATPSTPQIPSFFQEAAESIVAGVFDSTICDQSISINLAIESEYTRIMTGFDGSITPEIAQVIKKTISVRCRIDKLDFQRLQKVGRDRSEKIILRLEGASLAHAANIREVLASISDFHSQSALLINDALQETNIRLIRLKARVMLVNHPLLAAAMFKIVDPYENAVNLRHFVSDSAKSITQGSPAQVFADQAFDSTANGVLLKRTREEFEAMHMRSSSRVPEAKDP